MRKLKKHPFFVAFALYLTLTVGGYFFAAWANTIGLFPMVASAFGVGLLAFAASVFLYEILKNDRN